MSSKRRAQFLEKTWQLPVASHTPLSCPPTFHSVLSCLVPCSSGSSTPTLGLPDCFCAALRDAKLPLCVTGSTLPTHTHIVNTCCFVTPSYSWACLYLYYRDGWVVTGNAKVLLYITCAYISGNIFFKFT